jgi:hypothetical protein
LVGKANNNCAFAHNTRKKKNNRVFIGTKKVGGLPHSLTCTLYDVVSTMNLYHELTLIVKLDMICKISKIKVIS